MDEWTATFERLWRRQLVSVKQRAEQMGPHSEGPDGTAVLMTRPLRSKLCEATDSTWSPTY
jgi:hypothetical protein